MHPEDFLPLDYFVSFLPTLRTLFSVLLVSRALLGFFLVRVILLYLALSGESFSFDHCVKILCTFMVLFGSFSFFVDIFHTFRSFLHSIVSQVSRLFLGFSVVSLCYWNFS